MENYIVSARKYRPSTFESVVGQKSLTETLRNAIKQNHLAHAYLFCGPRGVGKTTCARIFAKTINCLNPKDGVDACNECESCKAFNEQRSFNIHELDAASNNSVDDIRALIDQVRIPPQIGKYSVYIIDEVHMLSQGAFNALLKTLEEPPSYAIFILATTEKHKVLPTILSRCQVYDFSRITVADTIAHLQYVAKNEGITANEEALNVVAQKADGGMRDALSIFDQLVAFCGNEITYERAIEVLNVLDSDYYFRLVEVAMKSDMSGALLLLNEVLQKGFDAGHFVIGFAQHLRDVLVSKDPKTAELLETSDAIRKRYAQQATQCSAPWLFSALSLLNDCDINYRTAKNKRLTIEIALVKLCQLVAPQTVQPQPAMQPITPQPKAQPTPPKAQPVSQPQAQSAPQASAPKMPAMPEMPKMVNGMPQMPKMPQMNAPQQAATASQEAPASAQPAQTNPFTQDQFNNAWAGLNALFRGESRLQAMLMECEPQPISDDSYRITLANPWQRDEIKQVMPVILNHLHKTLKNDVLQLVVEVAEQDTSRRAYTDMDKYKLLAEQNPALKTLKETFRLQFE
ncbi:MAG: DNA polymerase III subunit gamma/tau [Paludibacteraceae bacterium]|nr:DNA polymerase III subunit gamma/tau [Paludibacteraceae bacterium]